jgi:hypothetical protein
MAEEEIVNAHCTTPLGLDFKDREVAVAGRHLNGFRCRAPNRARAAG